MSIFYERLEKANEEIDRLRAENAELQKLATTKGAMQFLGDQQKEIDRLRAEKVEMLEAISLIEQRSKHAWTRMHCRALLAKANDPETDTSESAAGIAVK